MTRSRKPSDPYVVSDRTCAGCIYYGPLHTGVPKSIRCCNYTWHTGLVRPIDETCADCSVKQIGERQKVRVQINIDHSEDGIRQYKERMGITPRRKPSEDTIDPEDLQFLSDILSGPAKGTSE